MLRRILFANDPPAGGGGGNQTSPAATPPPVAATPAAPSGEESLIASLEEGLKPDGGSPPLEPPKPPEGGKPPEPPKPGTKPAAAKPGEKPPVSGKPAAATPPAGAKPDPTPLNWETAPKQFKLAHEQLKAEYQRTKTELEGKLQTVDGQLRELSGRKFLTPEDEQRYTNLEKRQQELEAELYSQNWQQSPEFKEKYEKPATKIFEKVNKELKGLTVKYKEGDEEKERPATIADFQRIRALGDSLSEQRKLAKQLFGDDADIILGHARKLDDITEAANAEIEQKRTGWADNQKKMFEQNQTTFQSSQRAYLHTDRLLVEKFPQYFAEDPSNPEYNKALKEGETYVDANSAQFGQKSPEEKAHTMAIIRRWAASWPANQILIKQLRAQLAEKDTEIAKFRESDPGNPPGGGGGGGDGGGDAPAGGSDALADDIVKMAEAART